MDNLYERYDTAVLMGNQEQAQKLLQDLCVITSSPTMEQLTADAASANLYLRTIWNDPERRTEKEILLEGERNGHVPEPTMSAFLRLISVIGGDEIVDLDEISDFRAKDAPLYEYALSLCALERHQIEFSVRDSEDDEAGKRLEEAMRELNTRKIMLEEASADRKRIENSYF